MGRWPRFLPSPQREIRIDEGSVLCAPIRALLFRFVFALSMVSAFAITRAEPASGAFVQDTQAEHQRTVWDGVYTEAQAERGQALYKESCAACHAPDLRGNSVSPSLVGMSFTFLWGGSTLGALFERIQEQMPPARPGTLSPQTYRDILAFVLRMNSYPTGAQELQEYDLHQLLISANPEPGR